MSLVTRDRDGKPDTPLSLWFGLLFIAIGLTFQATNIGPGGLRLSHTFGDIGINLFFILTGLLIMILGLFLTVGRRQES